MKEVIKIHEKKHLDEPLPCFSVEAQQKIKLTNKVLQDAIADFHVNMQEMVDKDNIMIFKHGPSWNGSTIKHDETREQWTSDFQTQSTETSISHADIKSLNLSAIQRLKTEFQEGLSRGMQKTLIDSVLEATADHPSHLLDVNEDIRPTIKALHQSITIGLNDDLTPSKPSLMLPPVIYEKLIPKLREIEKNDPEFTEELDHIRILKWLDALIKHFVNLDKFEMDENERNINNYRLQQLRKAQSSIKLRERRSDCQ